MTAVTVWQRRPILFGCALAGLTILGLIVMLGDEGLVKGGGLACAVLPLVLALYGYARQRRGGSPGTRSRNAGPERPAQPHPVGHPLR